MIKFGIGGANTKTGLVFQEKNSFTKELAKMPNYKVIEIKSNKWEYDVLYKEKQVAKIFNNYSIYNYLKKQHNIEWKNLLSKRLKPDDTIFVYKDNIFYVIEVKFQEVVGSTDEKLQTCDFKKKQWTKLLSCLNINRVEYFYILNEWFKKPEYKDSLDYIISIGCRYFFNYIPLNELGLKL